tara:strand:+ start:1283 stop:1600 length:318 start_codon:yes stop_codon:yes gene_type:complete
VNQEGRKLKSMGMKKVLKKEGAWFVPALVKLVKHLEGRFVTGEDLRILASQFNITPQHTNAWGAGVNALIRKGYLEGTGEYRQSILPQAHAHTARVYEVTSPIAA